MPRVKRKDDMSRQKEAIDGRMVTLDAVEIEAFAGKKICAGGRAGNRVNHKFHKWRPWRLVRFYSANGNKIFELEAEEGKALCRCQHCGVYLGCWQCVGLVQEMDCGACKKAGNKFTEMK